MNWIESLQIAIHYMEDHLLENMTIEQISAKAHISPFHFQRTFSLLTDVTVAEYIRRRRLTLAANELMQSDHKIIDLAHKYGFETPESFSKAFRRQHGIAPTEARKNSTSITSYNRLVIQLSLKGAEPMNYKIVEQAEFTLVGIKQAFSYVDGENLRGIAKMWQEAYTSGTENRLFELNNGAIHGLLGVCVDQNEIQKKQMEYWIATAYDGEVPEGLLSFKIPASKWSVFEVQGPMPESMQSLWKQIISEWFPSNPYEHAGIPELEVYPGPNQPPQIWIPIK
ncbi:AraC family transcriptional regulator [Paenibacillus sp. JNUCC31]|uniref:AraC family transcriptional regulator n=1 Tax=Paenibacillus sp. JNUCC-31 TaxID=2777983 RepID=UPI0017843F70|nr:AraC family transcriptional regulator [Paenibacillus sp. JNUCC-31]QOS79005.1 AraC family transcriptional regulator [Paenibacillus sp. JNUCC-31]